MSLTAFLPSHLSTLILTGTLIATSVSWSKGTIQNNAASKERDYKTKRKQVPHPNSI
jgi:hypothetical protein